MELVNRKIRQMAIISLIVIIISVIFIAKGVNSIRANVPLELDEGLTGGAVSSEGQYIGLNVTALASGGNSVRLKHGSETAWVSEGETYTFRDGTQAYVIDVFRFGPGREDFEVKVAVI